MSCLNLVAKPYSSSHTCKLNTHTHTHTQTAFNTDEIHIGGSNHFACIHFFCDTFKDQKCCFYNTWSPSEHQKYPFVFNIYGDSPINTTLSVEWVTSYIDHYPTDLGLHLEQDTEDPTLWVGYCMHVIENLRNPCDNMHNAISCSTSTFITIHKV